MDQTLAQVVLPYAPTLVLSPAIVARALPLTPACVAPETHSRGGPHVALGTPYYVDSVIYLVCCAGC